MTPPTPDKHGRPVVRISGVPYYLDLRLKQLRAVHNPRECIDLEGEGYIEADD